MVQTFIRSIARALAIWHEGSGNESEIFTVMLDKSTYFKKAA